MNKLKIVIGDWSQDGHNQYDEFVFNSNKTVKEIQEAYRESCRFTGLQLNNNEDYTGGKKSLNEGDFDKTYNHNKSIEICTQFEQGSLTEEQFNILKKKGMKLEEGWLDYFDGPEDFVDFVIRFIKLSISDLELEEASYKRSELQKIPAVNGWWGDLNHGFGYGIYSL